METLLSRHNATLPPARNKDDFMQTRLTPVTADFDDECPICKEGYGAAIAPIVDCALQIQGCQHIVVDVSPI